MGSTETDSSIIKKMGVNVVVIVGVLLALVYASYAINSMYI